MSFAQEQNIWMRSILHQSYRLSLLSVFLPPYLQLQWRSPKVSWKRPLLDGWRRPLLDGWDAPLLDGWKRPLLDGWKKPLLYGWKRPFLDGWWRPLLDGWKRPLLDGWNRPLLSGWEAMTYEASAACKSCVQLWKLFLVGILGIFSSWTHCGLSGCKALYCNYTQPLQLLKTSATFKNLIPCATNRFAWQALVMITQPRLPVPDQEARQIIQLYLLRSKLLNFFQFLPTWTFFSTLCST